MAVVKGSKNFRIKVVEYRLRNIVLAVSAVMITLCAGVSSSYFYGHKIGMAGQESAKEELAHLNAQLHEVTQHADELEQLLTNSKTSAEVDRQSNEDVRQEVIALKDEIARLDEENTFYRGLMSPNSSSTGLTIGAVELLSSRAPGVYAYKIVIQQLAARHNLLNGYVRFTVVGRQDGVEARIPLMALSESVSAEKLKLRFKYFQVFDGELKLPANFEPEGLEIEAKTTGKSPQTASKKFGWLVQEIE